MLANEETYPEYIQGTPEWLSLRKTKITATDAAVILGISPWKTRLQLYYEKTSDIDFQQPNAYMQRGLDLEPIARELFTIKKGIEVFPKVIVKDWAMASLDGINYLGTCVVEIKCPGINDHKIALSGLIPDHYYPQLQHQMYVCDVQEMYYFSFDGTDGVIITVLRDEEYIKKMIKEEKKFYECIINKTPPEPGDEDYQERNDSIWEQCVSRWKTLTTTIKQLEKEEKEARDELIFLSGGSNCKGAGIQLCQIQRRGNVDYSSIPELKNVNLDNYRKESTSSWRISVK